MQLPERVDVVVVGGGVMGTSTAFHLAEAGISVALFEANELASGSTSKAAGGVRANFSDELNIALGARSLDLFSRFLERPGYEIDLHRPGYLFALTKSEDVTRFEESTELQRSLGVESRMLSAQEASKISPLLSEDGVLACSFTPNDGHCTPESVVLGYAQAARKLGATVKTGVRVTGIDHIGGEINAVSTSAGRVETKAVINCAGAWSPEIAKMVELDLPVTPYRRELAITEPLGESFADLPKEFPMTIDYSTSLYWHREGRGILMGFSDSTNPPGFELKRDPQFAEKLGFLAEKRAPRLLDLGIQSGWSGLYEVTPDHNAILGEYKSISRFFYATGFSGHGFLQGPAIGEILRDLYLEREPFIDIRALSAERFTRPDSLRPELNIV
ncbi:MAG: FAD-binding oxidoreductase [Actinobacteria bacterium]|nr:FAD-binding oxidoreductase [Actinomycetota bacterium]